MQNDENQPLGADCYLTDSGTEFSGVSLIDIDRNTEIFIDNNSRGDKNENVEVNKKKNNTAVG